MFGQKIKLIWLILCGGLPCKARFCLSWHLFDKCQLCMQRLHSFDFNHNLKFENSWKFESCMYSLSEPSTDNRFIMRFSASPGSSGSNSQDKNSFTSTEPSLLISAASNIFIAEIAEKASSTAEINRQNSLIFILPSPSSSWRAKSLNSSASCFARSSGVSFIGSSTSNSSSGGPAVSVAAFATETVAAAAAAAGITS